MRFSELPALITALLRAFKSARIAASPPPVVAVSGVRPLSKPAGRIELAAAVLNMDASRLAAMSSRKSVETTASPEVNSIVSRDIGQMAANLWTGPNSVVVRLKARAGMGAPSPAHATSFAGTPCRRGMWIELMPASEVCRPAFISLAAALCGARDAMKSPTAFRASSAAQPVVVVVAGLVAARVRRSGVTSSLGQSRCATSQDGDSR